MGYTFCLWQNLRKFQKFLWRNFWGRLFTEFGTMHLFRKLSRCVSFFLYSGYWNYLALDWKSDQRAYARVGLMGNPSDGFYGKTISLSIKNFWAEVGEQIIFQNLKDLLKSKHGGMKEEALRHIVFMPGLCKAPHWKIKRQKNRKILHSKIWK